MANKRKTLAPRFTDNDYMELKSSEPIMLIIGIFLTAIAVVVLFIAADDKDTRTIAIIGIAAGLSLMFFQHLLNIQYDTREAVTRTYNLQLRQYLDKVKADAVPPQDSKG